MGKGKNPNISMRGELKKRAEMERMRDQMFGDDSDGFPVFTVYVRSKTGQVWYPGGSLKGDDRSKSLVESWRDNTLMLKDQYKVLSLSLCLSLSLSLCLGRSICLLVCVCLCHVCLLLSLCLLHGVCDLGAQALDNSTQHGHTLACALTHHHARPCNLPAVALKSARTHTGVAGRRHGEVHLQ